MTKNYRVYFIIGLLIIGGIAVYLYLQSEYFNQQSEPVETRPVSVELVEEGLDNNLELDELSNEEVSLDLNRKIEEPANLEKQAESDRGNSTEETGREVYIYRDSFKNPFYNSSNHNKAKVEGGGTQDEGADSEMAELSEEVEVIKSNLPFQLTGIIGNEQNRLAIIEGETGSQIIRAGDIIDEFIIETIQADGLLISYKGFTFKMKMESDSGDD